MTDMHNHLLPDGTYTMSAPGGPHPVEDHFMVDLVPFEHVRETYKQRIMDSWAKNPAIKGTMFGDNLADVLADILAEITMEMREGKRDELFR